MQQGEGQAMGRWTALAVGATTILIALPTWSTAAPLPPPAGATPTAEQPGPSTEEAEIDSCYRGFTLACRSAARRLLGGYDPPDWRRIAELHRIACRGGDDASCYALAQQYRYGSGVPTSTAKAYRLTRIACTRGYAPACTALAEPAAPDEADLAVRRGPRGTVHSYAGWLGASYVVAPLLAPVTAGLGLLLPSIVHWTHDEGSRGLVAPLMMAACTTGGALLGVGLGSAMGGPDGDLGAMVVGVLAGYAGWAVYDVTKHSDHLEPARRFGLLPGVMRREDGLVLGLSGWF